MLKFLKRSKSGEKGQALAIVLVLLAIGSLIIAVNLNYATTSLNGAGLAADDTRGVYAASAGVEHSLWSLSEGNTNPATSIPNINGMAVSIQNNVGNSLLTLDLGSLTAGGHSEWYSVSDNITWVVGNTYNFNITFIANADAKNNASVTEIGALLPYGYTYVAGSAHQFDATNLSYVLYGSGGSAVPNPQLENPTSNGTDSVGNQWLKWDWSQKGPNISKSTNYTQRFQITGTGSTGGSYSWITGGSNDIGTVGLITGNFTSITATARRPSDSKITGKVTADVILGNGGVYVLSWQVTK